MTPQEHYEAAEKFADKAEQISSGTAADPALKFAVLAVAHALLARPPSESSSASGPILPRKLNPMT